MLDRIEDAIEDIKNGKMVIVVDDEDRDNEGDFVTAARNVQDDQFYEYPWQGPYLRPAGRRQVHGPESSTHGIRQYIIA